jgi:hypothetical protein
MRSTKLDMDLVKRVIQRRDSFEVKKAWLNARMRDREDEFVDWQDIRSVDTVHHHGLDCVPFFNNVVLINVVYLLEHGMCTEVLLMSL